ncbi:LLM class flavin-dependent oxidoreductase [Streptomyces sp. YU58]|uniref:LLM class flavin-dependent oxidoreductase n=1 Tax=Streptomyces sp. SX92 TaxID=3158972 RepID=UPI0027BAC645|nr:LLM class flavin-dependent oxidoreductase [Streptomyces coralus]WLW52737.1 LLM class flavin-dependent oxidoreductase [Streptomyces coralus]
MNIGLGLPIDDPARLLTWARRADAGPFSTLGLLDRLVFDNPEPLITLATLAGATSRIRVQTEVLLAPHHNTALLAKQTATLDRISGGRLTLGIGVGGRADDCRAAGIDLRSRGRRLDEQMALLHRTWSGKPYDEAAGIGPIGPAPFRCGGPEVLFGGFAPAALERVGRFGDGFLGAALPPQHMSGLFRRVEEIWQRYDRPGHPRLVAQLNVVLGPQTTVDRARRNLRDYYAFTDRVDYMEKGLLTAPRQIREAIAALLDIGAEEVVLYCWDSDPDQIDRLSDELF